MRVLLLCLCCLLASVNGLYEEFFQIDLEGLMNDQTRMKALFDCLMDRGPCENFRIIKDTVPKLFLNKCEGCTAEQKQKFYKAVHGLALKYPKEYEEIMQPRLLRSSDLDRQTEELFKIDFARLLMDKERSKAFIDCLLDRGSCQNFQLVKETVPKLVQNKCKGCTPKQKEAFDWILLVVERLYPKDYAEFIKSLEKPQSGLTDNQEDLLKMDFTSILSNPNELHALVECLMDRGPCEKFQAFKSAGAKLLFDNCKGCTPEQREKFQNTIQEFIKKYPKGYEELIQKVYYPPASSGGEFDKLFEIDLESIINDEKQLTAIYNCLMDIGPCENYQMIKDLLPKLVVSECGGCTPEQKNIFDRLMHLFPDTFPKHFVDLSQKLKEISG